MWEDGKVNQFKDLIITISGLLCVMQRRRDVLFHEFKRMGGGTFIGVEEPDFRAECLYWMVRLHIIYEDYKLTPDDTSMNENGKVNQFINLLSEISNLLDRMQRRIDSRDNEIEPDGEMFDESVRPMLLLDEVAYWHAVLFKIHFDYKNIPYKKED